MLVVRFALGSLLLIKLLSLLVVQDLITEEIKYGSSVVVMATAQSTTSLNAALLPSRGSHVFRKIIEIFPPTLVSVCVRACVRVCVRVAI